MREQRRVSKESGCKGKERMRQREGQRENHPSVSEANINFFSGDYPQFIILS